MMSNELRPYEKYKESKNPFNSMIPEGWQESRFHNIVNIKSICGNSNEELLSVYLNQGVIKYSDTSQKQVHKPSEDMSNYQLVEPGDLVMNNQQAWRGSLGVSKHRGVVSPAYYVFGLSKNINSTFANYLFRESAMVSQYVTSSKGVGTIQRNLFYPYLKNAIVALPPRLEQDQIVKYLDHQVAKINKFIKAKKKLIAVLKEQKQAIINEAVTKGLDPNVKMKPSGIDWLGDVPDHWGLIRLKYLARKFGSGVTPKGGAAVYSQEGIPFLRSQNVYNEGLRLENVSYISKEINDKMFSSQVRPDDILLNITGASIGRVCKVPSDFDSANINQHICIIRLMKKKVDPQFVAYYLSSSSIQKQIVMLQNGASREGLPLKITKNFVIPLPRIEEQLRIIEVINGRTETLTSSILKIEKEIQLLSEYKDSLISNVVTGKVDVRNIAIDELEEEILEDIEIDEDSIEEESLEVEDGDE